MEEAEPRAVLEAHLVACVQESLALYMHDNACFLAERLVAEFPSEVGPLLCRCGGGNTASPRRPATRRRPPADPPACCATSAGQHVPAGHLLLPCQPALPDVPPAQGWAPGRRVLHPASSPCCWLSSWLRCGLLRSRQLQEPSSNPYPACLPAGLTGPQSRYLLALSCLQLGKLTEAETALMPDNDATRVGGAAGPPLGAGCMRRSAGWVQVLTADGASGY